MFGRVVGLISSIMCAFPFWVIAVYNKDSREPISFWSGDTSLKSKVKNIPEYNREMGMLYKKCSTAFLAAGIGFLMMPVVGMIILCFNCTLGIYFVYRNYKKILNMYS